VIPDLVTDDEADLAKARLGKRLTPLGHSQLGREGEELVVMLTERDDDVTQPSDSGDDDSEVQTGVLYVAHVSLAA
jgi:hypothetical protein